MPDNFPLLAGDTAPRELAVSGLACRIWWYFVANVVGSVIHAVVPAADDDFVRYRPPGVLVGARRGG